MFFAVIAAYVVATAFAFCGVVSMVSYIGAADRSMEYSAFLSGLVVAMWPIAVAMVLVLLTQIACLVEKWVLLWQIAQETAGPAETPKPKHPAAATPARAKAEEKPAPTYFPCDNIQAITPPLLEKEDEEKPAEATSAENSEQKANTPAAPASPDSPATQPPPARKKEDGLSFFKLD